MGQKQKTQPAASSKRDTSRSTEFTVCEYPHALYPDRRLCLGLARPAKYECDTNEHSVNIIKTSKTQKCVFYMLQVYH